MKRLLYIAFKDFANLHFGANAKVISQCRSFHSSGYDVELIGRRGADTVVMTNGGEPQTISRGKNHIKNKRLSNLMDKHRQIQDIESYIRNQSYDACYIRYDFSDPSFISLLKKLRKHCGKIALELPTYPYEDENKYGLLSKSKIMVDKIYRKQLHHYVDFIVTFYQGYDTLFGIPVMVIPNGFDFSTMRPITQELQEDSIHIIAVSSMREWHGYERFIEGMGAYYHTDEENKRNIVLHLVGNGREYAKYKALSEKYELSDHVVMEGAMHGEALDRLYEQCAIGIDSLARHRSGIDVLSSLKSREYGAKGIPMINSCRIDILEADFPYMLQVSADETPIDMNAVIQFYDRCFHSGQSRTAVAGEIRAYVEARSGMTQTLAQVCEGFAT